MIKKKLKNIYKYFIFKIFKFLYGEITEIIYPNKYADITKEKFTINNLNYNIYICKKSILYTDRIHNTAIIKDKKLIDGPSFQYVNNINKESSYNSVFSKGTCRLKKKLKGRIFSLLIGGGGNENYWHWLFDVLPKLHLTNCFNYSEQDFDYYLFPALDKNFQIETLDLLKIPEKKRLSSKFYRHIESDEIITVDHPYTLLNDPEKDSLNLPNWIINFLKESFKNSKIYFENDCSLPKKIYINRNDGTSLRFIINESEVEKNLIKKGFKSLTMSNYTFLDQIRIFKNADCIVGLHGAAFANLIFCKPKTSVIEIQPSSAGEIILNLSKKNFLNYRNLSLEPKTINHNNQSGDLEVELKDVTKILSS